MSVKNNVQVIINGNVYMLSGTESEAYLQKVASYINNKIMELKKLDSYKQMNMEYQNILLALNLADDYFKAENQIEELHAEISRKDLRLHEIKHEAVEARMKLETAQKLADEYKDKVKELQMRVIQLETEHEEQE